MLLSSCRATEDGRLLLLLPQFLLAMLSYSGLGLLSLSRLLEDQALKLMNNWRVCTFLFRTQSTLTDIVRTKYWNYCLLVVALSYSGLSLLSLCWRTQYQISHTVERLFLVAASSPASRSSSYLSHWVCSWAAQAPLLSCTQQHYCHTTCPVGPHSVEVTRTQFAVLLARIDPICSSDSECHLLRYLSTAVLGAEMNVSARVTLDTEFFCRCYAIQHLDFSYCRIRVTLDTVYNCRYYAFICWNGSEVMGLL